MDNRDLSSHNLANYYDNVFWIDGAPWYVKDRVLSPLSMPHKKISANPDNIRKALLNSQALMARWYDDWDQEKSGWWWTCCDNRQYDVDQIENARGRRGIRKGLRECDIRLVEPQKFVELSYDIYINALNSYGYSSSQIPSKKEYRDHILRLAQYSGTEIWGAFVKNELAAYAVCKIIDNAVNLGSTKSNSDLHRYCPNNALFYSITRHYLRERGVRYVTNGARTLLHTTSINDFLIRMGYRRIFCRIHVELAKFLRFLLFTRVDIWGKALHGLKILPTPQWKKAQSFLKLLEIIYS